MRKMILLLTILLLFALPGCTKDDNSKQKVSDNNASLPEEQAEDDSLLSEEADDYIDKYVCMKVSGKGRDIFNPAHGNGKDYRYGASIIIDEEENIMHIWQSAPGTSGRAHDCISYCSSEDNGLSFSKDYLALSATPGSKDELSACDPDVFYYDGYYYMGYTSTINNTLDGICNNVFLARSKKPEGPYKKWNGDGWGDDPEPILYYDGLSAGWGIGEPAFVVLDDTLYLFATVDAYTQDYLRLRTTQLWTTSLSDPNWPAHFEAKGCALNRTDTPETNIVEENNSVSEDDSGDDDSSTAEDNHASEDNSGYDDASYDKVTDDDATKNDRADDMVIDAEESSGAGVANDKYIYSDCDSLDVVYHEPSHRFLALATNRRFKSDSCLLCFESFDGLNFQRVSELNTNVYCGCHNCGLASDAQGHIKRDTPRFLSYAYSGNVSTRWGVWADRIAPFVISLKDEPDTSDDNEENLKCRLERSRTRRIPVPVVADDDTDVGSDDSGSADPVDDSDSESTDSGDDSDSYSADSGDDSDKSFDDTSGNTSKAVSDNDSDNYSEKRLLPGKRIYNVSLRALYAVAIRPIFVSGSGRLYELTDNALRSRGIKFDIADDSVCEIRDDFAVIPKKEGSTAVDVTDVYGHSYTVSVNVIP